MDMNRMRELAEEARRGISDYNLRNIRKAIRSIMDCRKRDRVEIERLHGEAVSAIREAEAQSKMSDPPFTAADAVKFRKWADSARDALLYDLDEPIDPFAYDWRRKG